MRQFNGNYFFQLMGGKGLLLLQENVDQIEADDVQKILVFQSRGILKNIKDLQGPSFRSKSVYAC
jgi:hypothetical protein